MNNKQNLIVVHNDFDGGASAICIINHIKQKYGINAEYKLWFGTYKNVDMYMERLLDEPNKYENIFIADIHISPELMLDLVKEYKNRIILLDHHASAENLKDIPNCIIDTSGKVCGAALCYKHLLKDQGLEYKHLTKLVAIANDYDLWFHKLPNKIAKNLNFIFYHYWGEKFVERFQMGFDSFNEEEKQVIKSKWEDIKKQLETIDFIDVLQDNEEYKGKFCAITVYSNKTAEVNELCEYAINELKYHVVIFINVKDRRMSVRISKHANEKGLHVGYFNTELNIGGGHPTAGGAAFNDEEHLKIIIQKYTDKIVELEI